MKKVILFASGGGSNVQAILNYFKDSASIQFPIIVTNNANAGVIQVAKEWNINVLLINKELFESSEFVHQIKELNPDLLVLAGFLWKIPKELVHAFPNKIINIHPALLPKHGGKGMYGHHVHEAVVTNGETESGITIHYVNEHYDEGTFILQEKISVEKSDNAEQVAKKVLALEHLHFAKVIEGLLA